MSDRPKRILIFHIGHIGDTLMVVPSLWALREAFPQASFYLLSDKVVGQSFTPSTEIFKNTNFFTRCFFFYKLAQGPKIVHFGAMLLLLPFLMLKRFNAVAYLVPSNRTEIQIRRDYIYFKLLGIKNPWGFHGFERVNSGHSEDTPEYQAILYRLKLDRISTRDPSMDLQLGEQEQTRVKKWLRQAGGLPKDTLIIGFGPGSKMQSKQWPLSRFYKVGKRLMNEHSIFPIILGGNEDAECGNTLVQRWGRGLNAAGALSVRESAVLLRRCDLYVGNDTGTMHLAAAVGTPCVAIFSARDIPGKWYPFGEGHTVLRESVDCELCKQTSCWHITCLKKISTARVLRAVQQHINSIRAYG